MQLSPITIPGIGTHSAQEFAVITDGEAVLVAGLLEQEKTHAPDYICEAYDIEEKTQELPQDAQIVVCVGHIRVLLEVIERLNVDLEKAKGCR